jgi:DnaK suppressor protein
LSDHLTTHQLQELRARLERERGALLRRDGPPVGADAVVETAGPTDMQEKAADEATRRALLTLDARARARVTEIDEALRRMDQGVYGVCEETGEPIPHARLRAEPTTRYTVEALELLEDERARDRSTSPDRDDGEAY